MSRTRKRRLMNQINVVPYIDVTLVLLVIFMITAPMTNPGVVELPKVGHDLQQPKLPPIVLTIKPDQLVEMEGKSLEKDQLLFEIRQQLQNAPDRSVVIAADKKVVYEDVVQIMNLLKVNKIDKVGLLLAPNQ
jgi:biopolymer transport protein TolR